MKAAKRYHIRTQPAPLPTNGSAAQFLLAEGDAYIKYGHPAFANTSHRGDQHWTPEVITQTWYQAQTGRIPISGMLRVARERKMRIERFDLRNSGDTAGDHRQVVGYGAWGLFES